MSHAVYHPRRVFTDGLSAASFHRLLQPLAQPLYSAPPLQARGNRPLQMSFEDQLKILIFFHLEEHTSGRHLLQVLDEDDFARSHVSPGAGIKKSSFFDALGNRGLKQLVHVFEQLQAQARQVLPAALAHLGELIAIDGSHIDAVLSMDWATYQEGSKKAKVHLGFDLNRGLPQRLFLTDANRDERTFVSQLLQPGQTGVMDRGYQQYSLFDRWQSEGRHFICRIKAHSRKTIVQEHRVPPNSPVFFDALALLGIEGINQTRRPVRLVCYQVAGKDYWIATDRHDMTAQEVADSYHLRWNIETFFGWWKRHLKVYPLLSRSRDGLMAQILGGLITYLLLAIYCHEEHGERVSIRRVRELRTKIRNETAALNRANPDLENSMNGTVEVPAKT